MSKTLINIITVVLMLSSFTFAVADNIAGDSNANNANNNSNSNVTNNADAGASNSSLNKDRENIKASQNQLSAQKGSDLTIKNAEQPASSSQQDQQPASQELQPRGPQGADNNANNKIILPSSSITNTRKGVDDELNNTDNNTDKLDGLDGPNVRDSNNPNNSNIAANNSNNNNNDTNNNVYGSKLNKDTKANSADNADQVQYDDQYNKQYNNKYNQDKLITSNRTSPTVLSDNSTGSLANNKGNNADNSGNTGVATDNSNYSNTQSAQEKLFFKNRPRVITAPDDKIGSLTNNSNVNRDNNKSDSVDSNTTGDKKIIGSSRPINGGTTSKAITTENTQDLDKQGPKPLKKSDDNTQEVNKFPAKRDFSAQCFYELVPRAVFHNSLQNQGVNQQNYLVEPLSLADYTKLLFINIKKDNIGVLNSLLNIVGTTEIKNSMGETPLTYAVKENKINSVRFLLTRKADIQAQNRNGQTVLSLANQLGNRSVIEALANSTLHETYKNKIEKIEVKSLSQ